MMNFALITACTFCVCGLLLAEFHGLQRWKWAAKPAASMFFVLLAYTAGAAETGYGQLILAGLMFCLAGDVLLIPTNRRSFLAGMAAFALGHGAYIAAFMASAETISAISVIALAGMTVVVALFLRRLWPHLAAFRWPVAGYSVIIALMVAASFSAAPNGRQAVFWLASTGAVLFAISDLAVARDQFVERNFFNRLWGLPLYYLAQMLIASSV